MRLYINDISLQGQFNDESIFENIIQSLINCRVRFGIVRQNLRTTRIFPECMVSTENSLRSFVQKSRNRDLRGAILSWLDRNGPFVDDDRAKELDDYFEYRGTHVTDSGLGEAARRVKNGEQTCTFSFVGGVIDFVLTPLIVDHGITEDRLGQYAIENVWNIEALVQQALSSGPPITSWQRLVETARDRFPYLTIPNSVYEDSRLAREPFEASIRDRTLEMFNHLNVYMMNRGAGGAEGLLSREIIDNYFVGDRAIFSGESSTNQHKFRTEMTFVDPLSSRESIFAHWHGKISHRFFRLHFQWPIPAGCNTIKILYLGPKLTKS